AARAPSRRAGAAHAGTGEALAVVGRRRAERDRARASRSCARAQQGAAPDLRDAPGAGSFVGSVDRIVRAAARATAGLVPSRRGFGHRAAGAVLAAAQALRLTGFRPTKKSPRIAGFFHA